MQDESPNGASRRILCILSILFSLIVFSACEKPAETENPSVYRKDGITFTHPGNWRVTEDVEEDGYRYLILETPGDALFMVQVYDEDEAYDLDSFVESYSDQVKTEAPFGTAEASSRSPIERLIDGELRTGIYERFSLRLVGIRVPQIVEYYRIESGGRVFFLISFVSDEDLEMVSPGFDQIFGSFAIEKRDENEDGPEPARTPLKRTTEHKRKHERN
ncbi:MAG: hypothetical protein IPM63_08120 [Acidobacteriota bacterium]|nr:MAG: hypothetical protein IPM63_08120 [Acidobacteriota bacterium]